MKEFELWLVNHGWPDIDDIDVDDLKRAIRLYGKYDPAIEPELPMVAG